MVNIMREANIPFTSLYNEWRNDTLSRSKIFIGTKAFNEFNFNYYFVCLHFKYLFLVLGSIEQVVGEAFDTLLLQNIKYVAIGKTIQQRIFFNRKNLIYHVFFLIVFFSFHKLNCFPWRWAQILARFRILSSISSSGSK